MVDLAVPNYCGNRTEFTAKDFEFFSLGLVYTFVDVSFLLDIFERGLSIGE